MLMAFVPPLKIPWKYHIFETVLGLKMCIFLFSAVEDMACNFQPKQLNTCTVRTIKDSLLR